MPAWKELEYKQLKAELQATLTKEGANSFLLHQKPQSTRPYYLFLPRLDIEDSSGADYYFCQ
jgi:hypothetical protein